MADTALLCGRTGAAGNCHTARPLYLYGFFYTAARRGKGSIDEIHIR